MNDTVLWILALTGGMVVGVFFFGGLWLTVKKAVAAKNTSLLFAASSVFRICVTLAGLYFISHGNLQRLLIAMIGFIAARFLVSRLTRSRRQPWPGRKSLQIETEVPHEVKS